MEEQNADTTAKKQVGRPFQKGQSGNPAGRPKGSISITTEIKKKLEEMPKGSKKTYLDLLVATILKKAIEDGNEQIIRHIWSYIDGLPPKLVLFGENEGNNKITSINYLIPPEPVKIQISPVLAQKYGITIDENGYATLPGKTK